MQVDDDEISKHKNKESKSKIVKLSSVKDSSVKDSTSNKSDNIIDLREILNKKRSSTDMKTKESLSSKRRR